MPFEIIELELKVNEIDVFKSISAKKNKKKIKKLNACESNKVNRKQTVFRENIPYLVYIWEFYSVDIYVYKLKKLFFVSLYVTLI